MERLLLPDGLYRTRRRDCKAIVHHGRRHPLRLPGHLHGLRSELFRDRKHQAHRTGNVQQHRRAEYPQPGTPQFRDRRNGLFRRRTHLAAERGDRGRRRFGGRNCRSAIRNETLRDAEGLPAAGHVAHEHLPDRRTGTPALFHVGTDLC